MIYQMAASISYSVFYQITLVIVITINGNSLDVRL